MKLEVSNVCEVTKDFCNDGGPELWEYAVYTGTPAATVTVLEADMEKRDDGASYAEWAFELNRAEDRRLDIVDGMEPVEITLEGVGVFAPESSVYIFRCILQEGNE